jgi:hypothetical protein
LAIKFPPVPLPAPAFNICSIPQRNQAGRDHLLGVEFRNAGCLARDPSQDVDLHGVRKGTGNGVGDDLENGVGAEVAEVVDIRLDHDAFDIPDGLLVAFVKSELDIGFAELDLLPTGGRARMKESGVVLDRTRRRSGSARA